MRKKVSQNISKKPTDTFNKPAVTVTDDRLHLLAFDNTVQANIITIASNGKVQIVNSAACKLLGYSKKELLTKKRSSIFNIKENKFKKMLLQRAAEGQSKALVSAIKKNGKQFPCEITSATFMDSDGIIKAITTLTDMSQYILTQKNIDIVNKKIVANDIVVAKSKQKGIDIKNKKNVAANISIAKLKQKQIDVKKKKIVTDNISLAKSKQKGIDIKNKKNVATNILIAKSKQKQIDVEKKKIVVDNISLAKSRQKGIDIKNRKNVADNITLAKSKQKQIDVEKKKIVTDNITLAKSKQKVIDVKNKKNVAANITIAKTKQIKIDVKNKKIVAHNINVAKSKQIKIDIKNEKIVAGNIHFVKSEQIKTDIKNEKIVADNIAKAQTKSDVRLAENNEWIKHVAKTSYDVMWDWDLASQTIYVGDSIKEIFGYKLKKNTMAFAAFCKCLVQNEREGVLEDLKKALSKGDKKWKASFLFKRHDGTIASTICRASIIHDETGHATRLIGAIQDVTILENLEQKLKDQVTIQEAQGEKFLLAAKLSFDVIWDWDVITNEVFIGEGFEELFGYKIQDNKGHMITDWAEYIHPEDKKEIEEDLYKCIRSTALEWEHAYRVTRADSSIAKVYARASIVRQPDGKALRMIGALQDLSKQNELEEKLDNEIKLKDRQITEATEDAKEMERSNIGKELHDNINQLLGASRMYLEMAKKGGNNSAMYLSRSSEYTLTAIEEIRKLSKGLTTDIIKNLGLCIAIDSLAIDMSEVNPVKISCALNEFNEKAVTDKFKLNLFRIVQEHLNNILKHAQATQVAIHLSLNKSTVMLDITDNGIGFDTHKKQEGIGLENIKSRAATYNGIAAFVSQPGKGCVLNIAFPIAV